MVYIIFVCSLFILIYYFSFPLNNKEAIYTNCSQGKRLYLSLKLIRLKILSYNNNSIYKSIDYIKKEFHYMKENVDEISKNNLDAQMKMIKHFIICNRLIKEFTKLQLLEQSDYIKKMPSYRAQYMLSDYYPEALYYKHGLYNLNKRILTYIENKDILDIGAYRGDSLIVFENYTNGIIYSYEISEYNVIQIYKSMKNNHANYSKHRIIHKGLSNFTGTIFISNSGKAGVSIYDKGKLNVNVTTIDNEVETNNINVGFIKADVEGSALELIKGGKNTIQKCIPLLSIAIYHNFDEYFEVRKYLNSLTSKYSYKYILANSCEPYACEFSLIAYPKYLK